MKLPDYLDYVGAVKRGSFADPVLWQASARRDHQNEAIVASGGFALTFAVNAGQQRFAVRCFRRQIGQLRERYVAVSDFVQEYRGNLEFLTDVAYVDEGIRVNGNVFPIVRMAWVEGEQLDSWVETHLHEPRRLDRIRAQIAGLPARLRTVGAAHGDLQHGNILVDRNDRLRLVDYDGMFLPALAGLGASEYGHRNFQHPDRADSYDKQLDSFAAYVIDLSLAAVQHDPSLWDAYNTGENLILEGEDFAAPDKSEVFARLAAIAPIAERTRRLMDACRANFSAVPAILAGERTSTHAVRAPGLSRRAADPRVLNAQDRNALIACVGDQVTIVGRVADTRIFTGRNTTSSFINFGNWRKGAVRIVAWGTISHELEVAFGKNAQELRGSWVTISGMVKQFHSDGSDEPSPQIELKRLQTLRVLSEADALARLAPPPVPDIPPLSRPEPASAPKTEAPDSDSTYRWKAPPKPKFDSTADNLAQNLHQLYSSPNFARPTEPVRSQAPSPPAYSQPPRPQAPQPIRQTTPTPRPPVPQPAPTPSWSFAPPPVAPRVRRAKSTWWQRLLDRLR